MNMKIVDAYWEKRNLGVSTVEVQMDSNDRIETLRNEFESISAEYIVVKVPSERNDISTYVQQKGFLYIEDMLHMEHDLHEVLRSRMHQRLYDVTTYRKMTDEDVEQLKQEIRMGMFSTDRISNDPLFDSDKVSNRYINWLDDLIKQSAVPYLILYKDDPAGFIILKTNDGKIYNSVLGGGYSKYRNTGLGIVQKEQEIVKELGGKRVETQVSSNNSGQLRALELNGYATKGINHVFVKHNG